MNKQEYLFKSERLGFRNWDPTDLEDTKTLMERLQRQFTEKGYTYFATELLQTGEFIGFIGLVWQDYKAPFTPATDIGWRLRKQFWGKGYATEGAKRCLEFAFNTLGLQKVVSVCPVSNHRSETVMKKIGMRKKGEFEHPGLPGNSRLNPCVWYEVKKRNFP